LYVSNELHDRNEPKSEQHEWFVEKDGRIFASDCLGFNRASPPDLWSTCIAVLTSLSTRPCILPSRENCERVDEMEGCFPGTSEEQIPVKNENRQERRK